MMQKLVATFLAAAFLAIIPAAAKPRKHSEVGVIAGGVPEIAVRGPLIPRVVVPGAVSANTYPAYTYGGPVYYAPACYVIQQPVRDVYKGLVAVHTIPVCE